MEAVMNVIALVKDGERYVFLYDDQSAPQLLQTLGRYAADPELNFTWYDAAVLRSESAPDLPRRDRVDFAESSESGAQACNELSPNLLSHLRLERNASGIDSQIVSRRFRELLRLLE